MKIHNETKIGLLAVVGIVLLIFGFNFLKGKHLFKKEKYVYAVFEDIQGLTKSNPVFINGFQVGTIANLDGGTTMRRIVVTVNLTKDVNIPDSSLAVINPNLLGSVSLEIKLGNSSHYLKEGDTLITSLSGSAAEEVFKRLDQVLYEVRNATRSLDSVLHLISNVFDANAKNNIKATLANLSTITGSFSVSAVSLQTLLDPKNGYIAKSLENINTFTAALAANNMKLNSIMTNAEKASANFANIDVRPTLVKLDSAVNEMKAGLAKINSTSGSLGALLNDRKLYDYLTATSYKINTLIDDIRVHPKRYLPNISLIGGKRNKEEPINSPIVNDTIIVDKKK